MLQEREKILNFSVKESLSSLWKRVVILKSHAMLYLTHEIIPRRKQWV